MAMTAFLRFGETGLGSRCMQYFELFGQLYAMAQLGDLVGRHENVRS